MSPTEAEVLALARPLIQHFEKCELKQYDDARGLPTIGWGVRIRDGQYPNGISQAQADEMFANILHSVYGGVCRVVTRPDATAGELAALVSFAYNIGFGQIHPYVAGLITSTLLRLYNAGQRQQAAEHFAEWDHAGAIELAGLLARRKCEALLFKGGTIKQLQALGWYQRGV